MRTVAIIPAKGYSRRVPKKNMRMLAGKPLLFYSISAIKNSPLVDEIYVSTDDSDIADFARSLGAKVPFLRDASLSGDAVHGTLPVINMLTQTHTNIDENLYCLRVLPPYPFLTSDSITAIVEKSHALKQNVLSIASLGINEYHLRTCDEDGLLTPTAKEAAVNFQIDDAPELYALCGAAQCMPAPDLVKLGSYQLDKPVGHSLPYIESFELDTLEAFALAEKIAPVLLP